MKIFVSLLLLLLSAGAQAAPPVRLDTAALRLNLEPHLEFALASDSQDPNTVTNFQSLADVPFPDGDLHSYWFRFRIEPSKAPRVLFLVPLLSPHRVFAVYTARGQGPLQYAGDHGYASTDSSKDQLFFRPSIQLSIDEEPLTVVYRAECSKKCSLPPP